MKVSSISAFWVDRCLLLIGLKILVRTINENNSNGHIFWQEYLFVIEKYTKAKRLLSCWFSIVQQVLLRKVKRICYIWQFTFLRHLGIRVAGMPRCICLSLNTPRHTRQVKDLKRYSKILMHLCLRVIHPLSHPLFFFPHEFSSCSQNTGNDLLFKSGLRMTILGGHSGPVSGTGSVDSYQTEAPVRKTLICKGTVETGLMH